MSMLRGRASPAAGRRTYGVVDEIPALIHFVSHVASDASSGQREPHRGLPIKRCNIVESFSFVCGKLHSHQFVQAGSITSCNGG
jgi:hypothetical protein